MLATFALFAYVAFVYKPKTAQKTEPLLIGDQRHLRVNHRVLVVQNGMEKSFKLFILIAAAGVTTAIAIELVTKRTQDMAILSARAELQRLMVAAVQQQQQSASSEIPPLFDGNLQV